MPISTINEVLFMGSSSEDYASGVTGSTYPPYSGENVYWRPGTVRMAVAGDLVINLPRKIAAPDYLCIHASLFIPASPATGWQGKQVLTLRDGGVPKLGFHMFGNTISVGQSWHYWNGSGQKTSLFGTTSGLYSGFPNVGDGVPSALVQGTLQRRTWVVRYDAVTLTYPENTMHFDTIKVDWSTGSTSPAVSGVPVLGGSTGIDSIVLGSLEGALWSEVIVTLENTAPTMSGYGGQRLYMIDLPPTGPGEINVHGFDGGSADPQNVTTSDWTGTADRLDDIPPNLGYGFPVRADSVHSATPGSAVGFAVSDLPHPFGIVTGSGNPGDPWTGGYAGVVNGETWSWECYGVKVSASAQTDTANELSSTPTGPDKLQVGLRLSDTVQPFSTPPVAMPAYSPDNVGSYGTVAKIWELNPATGQRFTVQEVNSLSVAVRTS